MKKTMTAMVATVALAYILCTLSGCSYKDPLTPVRESLTSQLIQVTGADERDVRITRLEIIDSVSYAAELDSRKMLFLYKKAVEKSKRDYYQGAGMPRTARQYSVSMDKSDRILQGLDTLKQNLGEKSDKVAYYECVYTAKVETDEYIYHINDWHFIITPRGRILAMKPSYVGLRNGMGKLIPGYMTLLGHEEVTEEELEKYNDNK